MPKQNQTARESKQKIHRGSKVSVTHDFSEGEEQVTILGTTKTGLIECKRPETEGGAILLFRFDERAGKLKYVAF